MADRLRLWLERGDRGYHLRDAVTEDPVGWMDPRIRVIPVAGVSYRPGALDDPSFNPGRRLALVPEPDNPHDRNAVAIYNEERTLQLGYVPAAVARPRRRRAGRLAVARRRRIARACRSSRFVDREPSLVSST